MVILKMVLVDSCYSIPSFYRSVNPSELQDLEIALNVVKTRDVSV